MVVLKFVNYIGRLFKGSYVHTSTLRYTTAKCASKPKLLVHANACLWKSYCLPLSYPCLNSAACDFRKFCNIAEPLAHQSPSMDSCKKGPCNKGPPVCGKGPLSGTCPLPKTDTCMNPSAKAKNAPKCCGTAESADPGSGSSKETCPQKPKYKCFEADAEKEADPGTCRRLAGPAPKDRNSTPSFPTSSEKNAPKQLMTALDFCRACMLLGNYKTKCDKPNVFNKVSAPVPSIFNVTYTNPISSGFIFAQNKLFNFHHTNFASRKFHTSKVRLQNDSCDPPKDPNPKPKDNKDILCKLDYIFRDMDVCEKIKLQSYYEGYSNLEYHKYHTYSFYDLMNYMKSDRQDPPSNKKKKV